MEENNLDIQDYLNNGVEIILKDALKATLKNPKESLYLLKFSKHAKKATKIREKYHENGKDIPVFLIASITSSCNLHCTQEPMMHAMIHNPLISLQQNNGMRYSNRQEISE